MVSFPLPCYSWVFGWPGTAKHLKGLSHSTPDISPDGLRLTDCLSFHQKSAEDPLIPRVPGGTMSESTLIPSNPGPLLWWGGYGSFGSSHEEIADADWHELAIERIYLVNLVFCSIITHILTPQNTLILQNYVSSCIVRAFCDIAPCFGLVQFDATPCAQDPKARDLVQVGFPLCPND